MYDIDIYSYKDQPEVNNGKYNIYPLNEKGVRKYYLNKESHAITYLSHINPIIFEHILGKKYEDLIKKEETKEPTIEDVKEDNLIQKPIEKKETKKETEEKKEREDKGLFEKKLTKINNNRKLSYNKSCDDIFEKSQRRYKPNKYFRQFHRKMGFEDVFGYPMPLKKETKGDIINNEISFLKDEISSSISKRSQSTLNIHSPTAKPSHLTPFSIYTKNLNHSMNIHQSSSLNSTDTQSMASKNKELRKKLLQQTNQSFLKKIKLPDIRKVANTRDLIRRLPLGFTKYMSEKYNKEAFVDNKANVKGRNYVGGIFQY